MLERLQKHAVPLSVAAGTRLGFMLAALFTLSLLGPTRPNGFLLHGGSPHPVGAVDLFQRWDAYWFLNIAREGYQYHGVQPQVGTVPIPRHETNITPFPLYPLGIQLLSLIIPDPSLAGLLVSISCYFISMLLLYHLWRERRGKQESARALLYLSLAPGAFLYNAVYSESLFLLLSLLCLSLAARGRPLWAGLCGMGASATRLAGLLLAPAVFIQFALAKKEEGTKWWNPEGSLDGLLCAALTTSGAGLYMLYLYHLTGDWLVYFTAQQGWHKALAAPWTVLAGQLQPGLLQDPVRLLNLGSAGIFIGLCLSAFRPRNAGLTSPGERAYLVLGTLMPLCSSNLLGLPRYLMVLFPVYPLMARQCRSIPCHAVITLLFAALNIYLITAWLGWSYSL